MGRLRTPHVLCSPLADKGDGSIGPKLFRIGYNDGVGRAKDSIPEPIRAELLALGIPAAEHSRNVLASYFPKQFNIGATGMDAEDLGRVLLYFVDKKVISVSGATSPGSVKKVQPGWHFCQFYRNFNQLVDMVAPYIAEGLRNREGCFWVLPKVVTKKSACDALAKYVEDVDAYFASGQLEMCPHPSWYLDSSGRLKTFEQIASALLQKQDRALDKGFKFLRAAGDAGWVSGTQESKSFIDYEMKVNAALGATKVAAVCTYRASVTADEFVAIVTAHQDALNPAKAA